MNPDEMFALKLLMSEMEADHELLMIDWEINLDERIDFQAAELSRT